MHDFAHRRHCQRHEARLIFSFFFLFNFPHLFKTMSEGPSQALSYVLGKKKDENEEKIKTKRTVPRRRDFKRNKKKEEEEEEEEEGALVVATKHRRMPHFGIGEIRQKEE